jgi:hypothetical protein
MALDERLAGTVRDALAEYSGTTEKQMMGSVCFFHHGNIVGGSTATQ